ncbi:PilZ domain-containing protein [bacterium]|nr:MAG: PilZ domain-containing protein [bacterium]
MASKHGIRNAKRAPVLQETEVTAADKKYSGTIENVSETGLNIIVPSEECVTSFIPGSKVTVTFRPAEKEVNIQCEVSWVRIDKNPSHGIMYTLAMEVIQGAPEYREYIKNQK